MTNWNAIPRDEVELAATAGDEEAQACLRLHQRLDRIDTSVAALKDSLRRIEHTTDVVFQGFHERIKSR